MRHARGLLIASALAAATASAGDMDARVRDSREVVKDFMQELKGELQAAMKAGGPVEAIAVCNVEAPKIAAQHSAARDWDVGRTSLKVRNPANAPDAWERKVLEQFQQRRAAGEDPQQIEHWEVVENDGQQQFRYMKAIPTGAVCLTCHGSNIAEPVAEKLDALYPADTARGSAEGDSRCAFSSVQPR